MRQVPGRRASASVPCSAVRTMTPRVPLHAVVKNHGPQLQKRAASPCVVELVLWYVPDAAERASTCRALHETTCIMRLQLQTTTVCCSDNNQRTAPWSAVRLSASCFATRVAQCERLLKETWTGARTWGASTQSLLQRPGCPSPTRLVSQQCSAPGPSRTTADSTRAAYRGLLTQVQSLANAALRTPDDRSPQAR